LPPPVRASSSALAKAGELSAAEELLVGPLLRATAGITGIEVGAVMNTPPRLW
jgi:hypothetical protein